MLGARFRKLSVCIALTANSIRSSIGSLFFHGMPRFYLTTPPKSVTYVLNLLCYLCSEPAPTLNHQSRAPCSRKLSEFNRLTLQRFNDFPVPRCFDVCPLPFTSCVC